METLQPVFLCANWTSGSTICGKNASFECQNCQLVVYCSQRCQIKYAARHAFICNNPIAFDAWLPTWVTDRREPRFMDRLIHPPARKHYWGTIPALDILKLPSNEGASYQRNLKLMFAASGDLRNVIKTVADLPDTYNQKLTIIVSDGDFDITARNVILLLLLTLESDDVGRDQIVDCMIHVWYSAFLRQSDLELLQTHVRPMVQTVVNNIRHKEPSALMRKSWVNAQSGRVISVALQRAEWEKLLLYFEHPAQMSWEVASVLRRTITEAPLQKDNRECGLFMKRPRHRVPLVRFIKEGILLPFSASRQDFRVPNPTFFQDFEGWRMMEDANPLRGWPLSEVHATDNGGAAADIYGKLFYYLRAMLGKFLVRSEAVQLDISVYCVKAQDIPSSLGTDGTYDRIETSDIADEESGGIQMTLKAFSLMLSDDNSNRHATIITLFTRAVQGTMLDEERSAQVGVQTSAWNRLTEYLPPTRMPNTVGDPEFIRFTKAEKLVMTYDGMFRRYIQENRFHAVSQATGLVMKRDNTIVSSWPFRLKLWPSQPGAQEEFDHLLESGLTSQERYVEWVIRPRVPAFPQADH